MSTPKPPPRVYLAGKIHYMCWRHGIVRGLRNEGSDHWNPYAPPSIWPVLPGGVLGGLADYTGPYFVGCDHGCAHGNDAHGLGGGGCIPGGGGLHVAESRERSYELCRGAMGRSNIVFAYIDEPDCFGTLIELGWASALAKKLWVCFPDPAPDWVDDMWFVQQAADAVGFGDPAEVLRDLLLPLRLIESPAEQQFWNAHSRLRLPELKGLVPQYKVPPYRLDFAIPERQMAIEIDGYAYHSGREVFVKDRSRQRELEIAGWRFVRFAGKEALDTPEQCVKHVARAVSAFGGR